MLSWMFGMLALSHSAIQIIAVSGNAHPRAVPATHRSGDIASCVWPCLALCLPSMHMFEQLRTPDPVSSFVLVQRCLQCILRVFVLRKMYTDTNRMHLSSIFIPPPLLLPLLLLSFGPLPSWKCSVSNFLQVNIYLHLIFSLPAPPTFAPLPVEKNLSAFSYLSFILFPIYISGFWY